MKVLFKHLFLYSLSCILIALLSIVPINFIYAPYDPCAYEKSLSMSQVVTSTCGPLKKSLSIYSIMAESIHIFIITLIPYLFFCILVSKKIITLSLIRCIVLGSIFGSLSNSLHIKALGGFNIMYIQDRAPYIEIHVLIVYVICGAICGAFYRFLDLKFPLKNKKNDNTATSD